MTTPAELDAHVALMDLTPSVLEDRLRGDAAVESGRIRGAAIPVILSLQELRIMIRACCRSAADVERSAARLVDACNLIEDALDIAVSGSARQPLKGPARARA